MEFVDLARRFVRHSTAIEVVPWTTLWAAGLPRSSLSRKDLLQQKRVVVLGDAGAGKSAEVRGCMRELRASGEPAWELAIQDLHGPVGLEALRARLAWWLDSAEPGWFFIDDVDKAEAYGTTPRAAVQCLGSVLGSALGRARVFLFSRTTEWSAIGDQIALEEHLHPREGFHPSEGDDPDTPCIVHLAPLDQDQIRLLAQAAGVEREEDFVDSLWRDGLRPLAHQPGEVLRLLQRWRPGQMGGLREVLDADLNARLTESDPTRGAAMQTSPRDLREGAARLALGLTLTRRSRLKLPGAPDLDGEEDLDPQEILDDWEHRRILELLRRPVFRSVAGGRVEFAYPAMQERLVGSALAGLIELGGAEVKPLLWGRRRDGAGSMTHTAMRGVLPWVAAQDPDTLDRLVELAPELLVMGGDPDQIPPATRGAILDAVLDDDRAALQVANRARRVALCRFALPSMGRRIVTELRLADQPHWRLELLLTLVAAGATEAVGGAVIEILEDTNRPAGLRAIAVSALAAADRTALGRWGARAKASGSRIPAAVLAALLKVDPPDDLVLEVARRCAVGGRGQGATELDVHLHQFLLRRGRTGAPSKIAFELIELLEASPIPAGSRREGWAPQLDWLVRPLAHLLARAWSEAGEEAFDLHAWRPLVAFFERCWWELHLVHEHELQRALRENPQVRRALFWDAAEQLRATTGLPKWEWEVRGSSKLLDWNHDDFDWMLEDAERRSDLLERRIAFDGALRKVGSDPERRARVDEVAATSEQLAKRWARVNNRPSSPGEAERRAEGRYRELRIRARELREARNRDKSKENLGRVIADIRAGTSLSALRFLYDHLRDDPSKFTRSDWEALEEPFGPELALAARDGWVARWRGFRPPLPHEVSDSNSTMLGTILGLVGIAIELDGAEAVAVLSEGDVDLALRHGLRELNQPPPWFEGILEAHPGASRATLTEAALGELRLGHGEGGRTRVIHMIRMDRTVGELMAPVLPSLLKEELQPRLPILRDLLAATRELLSAHQLAELALTIQVHFEAASGALDRERTAAWWTLWLRADGDAALAALEGSIDDGNAAWFEVALSSLGPDDLSLSLHAVAQLAVACLKWESRRDESGRGPSHSDRPALAVARRLLSTVARDSDPRAASVLAVTAKREDAQPLRPWLEEVMRQNLETAGNGPWSPARVRSFLRRLEQPPETATELFELVLGRIADIRDDMERGRFSLAALFPERPDESVVQIWLAHELHLRRRGRYRVDRETEIDHRRRPDLVVSRVLAGEVRIEVKVAESCSLTKLRRGLRSQLVGQYLKPRSLRHGIYFLACARPTRVWRDGDSKRRLSWSELLEVLGEDARRIVADDPDIDDLAVVGVLLSPPSE